MNKDEQKHLLIEMMREDEKSGMYEKSDNELIAEFMGADYQNILHNHGWHFVMPIVEFIEEIEEPVSANPMRGTFWPYEIIRRKKGVEVYNDGQILFGVGGGDVSAVYKAVVEFVKWYNSQQHESK